MEDDSVTAIGACRMAPAARLGPSLDTFPDRFPRCRGYSSDCRRAFWLDRCLGGDMAWHNQQGRRPDNVEIDIDTLSDSPG
jgi:hypothetical protein